MITITNPYHHMNTHEISIATNIVILPSLGLQLDNATTDLDLPFLLLTFLFHLQYIAKMYGDVFNHQS